MALLWAMLLAWGQWAGAEMPFVRLEDPDENDRYYSISLRLFEEIEPVLRAAAEKMLEAQTQRLVWYYSDEDGNPELSVWNEVHGKKESLSEEEYPEYLRMNASLSGYRTTSSTTIGAGKQPLPAPPHTSGGAFLMPPCFRRQKNGHLRDLTKMTSAESWG